MSRARVENIRYVENDENVRRDVNLQFKSKSFQQINHFTYFVISANTTSS